MCYSRSMIVVKVRCIYRYRGDICTEYVITKYDYGDTSDEMSKPEGST